jgi:23S rRNA (cytidine1920-2'-O)/16S rRNA (cytidine1409-2'-O)-methyltransferase
MTRRRLDTELVRRGIVPSRAKATEAIASGRVLVAGAPAATAARQVRSDEPIAVLDPGTRFVSRGGDKLDAALQDLHVDVEGRRALDAGASTGGFTDCLLQHGVDHVHAVDVGHGQLDWRLRNDARVTVLERTNLRRLAPEDIGGAVPLAVADLSFISLLTVAPALARCTTSDADLVLLVKPQFEAGRGLVGKGGVVRDPAVHAEVLARVTAGLDKASLPVVDAVPSALPGADGNREFFVHCRRGGTAISEGDVRLVAEKS